MIMIEWDDKILMVGLDKADAIIVEASQEALEEMADTLLVLSRYEVPHDEGILSGSGHVGDEDGEVYVAYNTEYAAYQHEGIRRDGTHKIRHYQKGRKGKYLEDPLKNNLSKWQEIARDRLRAQLAAKL